MKQQAEVTKVVAPGYVEVKIRRQSACASAHKCGSCDACSLMANAPEILVVASGAQGVSVGDRVTVETATPQIMGAAMVLYLLPFFLFFLGYGIGKGISLAEGLSIALGGGGFLLGILCAVALDRYYKNHRSVQFKVVSLGG